MARLALFLSEHGVALALALAAVALGVAASLRRRPVSRAAAFALGALAVGGVLLTEFGGWVALLSIIALALAGIVLLASARWSPWVARVSAVALCLGLGGWGLAATQSGANEAVAVVRSLEFGRPAWLVLLAVLPWLWWASRKSLAGLGPFRARAALGLRMAVVTLLVLALAELRVSKTNETTTVLYLVDRSLSVPQEVRPDSATAGGEPIDARWERVQRFLREAAAGRGPGNRLDASGAALFARRARLALPPSPVDALVLTDAMAGPIDGNYTDIAGAIKLALASFPEDTGKRIVLVSDGNENLGDAEAQAQLAKQNGVQIDVVTLAAGYRNEGEILVQAVEAPPVVAAGQRLPPVRVLIRNASKDRIVGGTLELLRVRDGSEEPIPISEGAGVEDAKRQPARVLLRPGLNSFSFRDAALAGKPKAGEEASYSYKAVFSPQDARPEAGGVVTVGVPGDRFQNNRAGTHVIARGQRRVLFLEPAPAGGAGNRHQHLIDALRRARLLVTPLPVERLPQNRAELGVFLADYDCVVVANIPSELLSREQQDVLRANTFDQGCGLVVVGGPESYGAGGYQDTPLEKAMPVDCRIKALKAAGKGGLVMIMHASEMADGNRWQKEIGKLAIQKLSPIDMVGVIYYGFGGTVWHIPFQEVGEDRERLYAAIDRMTPGDMPDFDPGLKMALDTLSDASYGLSTKHMIVISDGDPGLGAAGEAALQGMKENKITCTAVGVATHGVSENTRMEHVATTTGGKFYNVTDPSRLPAIYIREARRVSQSFLYERQFSPKLQLRTGPTDRLTDDLPPLYGFIRTSMKDSPLAEMLIEGPRVFDQKFPVLATWQYGLGRSAAFTSDARSVPPGVVGWDKDWAGSDVYLKFWEQTVAWAMRGVETGKLSMSSEYRDGKLRVTVSARDERNRPITGLKLTGGVSTPGATPADKPTRLEFRPKAAGTYEAEFAAEEAGSYFLSAQALDAEGKPADGVRAGATIPYSPEFTDLESNTALLKRLAEITGGNVYGESAEDLRRLAASGELYRDTPERSRSARPVWFWLIFAACVLFAFDVGVRRVAVEPGEVSAWADKTWRKLRTREQSADEGETFDALARAKAKAAERIDRSRAARRFEPTEGTAAPAPAGADATTDLSPPPPAAPRRAEPKPDAADGDVFSRLQEAKRRAKTQRRDDEPPAEGGPTA